MLGFEDESNDSEVHYFMARMLQHQIKYNIPLQAMLDILWDFDDGQSMLINVSKTDDMPNNFYDANMGDNIQEKYKLFYKFFHDNPQLSLTRQELEKYKSLYKFL